MAFNCYEKKASPLKQYLKVFFSSVKRLTKNYIYAEEHKILVPFTYIHRIIRCITNKQISNKDKSQFIVHGLAVIKERSPIMEWLGLQKRCRKHLFFSNLPFFYKTLALSW